METFFATFMGKQAFKRSYVEIQAESEGFAREAMIVNFGNAYMTVYRYDDFIPQIAQYGLERLCVIDVINHGRHPEHPSLEFVLVKP